MNCNLCGIELTNNIYQSGANRSLTSLCTVYQGATEVYACTNCGHVQSAEMPNIDGYYDQDYDILVASEDEDQIYQVVGGVTIFRTEHQVRTLLGKGVLERGAKILDYGCAKSSTMRALQERQHDIHPYLYDVSDRYIPFWEKFLTKDRWATYNLPSEWDGFFDVVTSFFSLEHMAKPQVALTQIRRLLKTGGVFYGIVPNVFNNIADMIVVDHVNHFTPLSLRYLLANMGFEEVDIDTESHKGALIFSARKSKIDPSKFLPEQREIEQTIGSAEQIARFWSEAGERVRFFEKALSSGAKVAIYGAGFYGMFIASSLLNLKRIECVIDQNVFLQGRTVNGLPVVAPQNLPPEINTIMVGLNPAVAKNVMAEIACFNTRDLNFFYL